MGSVNRCQRTGPRPAIILKGVTVACLIVVTCQNAGTEGQGSSSPSLGNHGADDFGVLNKAFPSFLLKDDMEVLQQPNRRRAARSPEDYWVYNATDDRWKPGVWKPVATPGSWGEYKGPTQLTDHPAFQRNDAKLYHRITGKRLNVSQALRDPASVPFCESLAYGLGGVAPNVGVEAHLDKLLFNAVEDADVALAALLIRAGANASVAPVYRFSALHEAAFQGNVSMIDLLVDSGADPTMIDDYHRTPLHWAAFFGRLDACEALLLRIGSNRGGRSANVKLDKELDASDDTAKWVDTKDINGDSPLLLAFIAGHNPLASVLLRVRRKGLPSACKLAEYIRRTVPQYPPYPRPSPVVPGLTHRKEEDSDGMEDSEENSGSAAVPKHNAATEDRTLVLVLVRSQASQGHDTSYACRSEDPMENMRTDKGAGGLLGELRKYLQAIDAEKDEAGVGNEVDALEAFEEATSQYNIAESSESEEEPRDWGPGIDWGPGTDNPNPWNCYFCSKSFGTYDDAVAHEKPCGESKGWEMRGQDGWVRTSDEQVFAIQENHLQAAGLAVRSQEPHTEDSAMTDLETAREIAEEPDIEDAVLYTDVDVINSNAAVAKREAAVAEAEREAFWLPPRREDPPMSDDSECSSETPEERQDRIALANRVADFVFRPVLFKRFPYEKVAAKHGWPVGIATKAQLEQLPTWLRDPETYAAWRRGEVNGPKMEKREAASAGKTALADLDEADRVELGGVVQGSVSQTQSVMRKQAIRNMRAPQLLDALQAHGVVFSPSAEKRKTIASLRTVLTDVEIELGLIISPPGWDSSRSRRSYEIDNTELKRRRDAQKQLEQPQLQPQTRSLSQQQSTLSQRQRHGGSVSEGMSRASGRSLSGARTPSEEAPGDEDSNNHDGGYGSEQFSEGPDGDDSREERGDGDGDFAFE